MTNTPNTDAGALYVGDLIYCPESDTYEQVERLQWVANAERQDLLILTTNLSVRTVRFSHPIERVARGGRVAA